MRTLPRAGLGAGDAGFSAGMVAHAVLALVLTHFLAGRAGLFARLLAWMATDENLFTLLGTLAVDVPAMNAVFV